MQSDVRKRLVHDLQEDSRWMGLQSSFDQIQIEHWHEGLPESQFRCSFREARPLLNPLTWKHGSKQGTSRHVDHRLRNALCPPETYIQILQPHMQIQTSRDQHIHHSTQTPRSRQKTSRLRKFLWLPLQQWSWNHPENHKENEGLRGIDDGPKIVLQTFRSNDKLSSCYRITSE